MEFVLYQYEVDLSKALDEVEYQFGDEQTLCQID